MCTIIACMEEGRFILASNRDIPPDIVHTSWVQEQGVVKPVALPGNIAVSTGGRVGVLIEYFADPRYVPRSTEPVSRTEILPTLFAHDMRPEELAPQRVECYSPFELLLYEPGSHGSMHHYRWNGGRIEEIAAANPFFLASSSIGMEQHYRTRARTLTSRLGFGSEALQQVLLDGVESPSPETLFRCNPDQRFRTMSSTIIEIEKGCCTILDAIHAPEPTRVYQKPVSFTISHREAVYA